MPRLTERFDAALLFASRLHRRQTRKGSNIPYISHLLAVTSLVIEAEGTEDEAIAALLHDSIEDCGDSYPGGRNGLRDYIGTNFGEDVLKVVNGCTDDEGHEKGRPSPQRRKREGGERAKSHTLPIWHPQGTQ